MATCAPIVDLITGSASSASGSSGSRVSGGGPVCARTRSSSVPTVRYIGIGRAGACAAGSAPPENAAAASTVERSTASRAANPAPLEKPDA